MSTEPRIASAGGPATPSDNPVHGIDLAGYASVSAMLATGQPRDAVLANHNLTDADWLTVERTWALRLAAHAQRGDHEFLFRFERAYTDALQAITPEEPQRPLPVYAQIVSALESGIPALVICAQAGLTLAQLGQLQRSWTQRLVKDKALNLEYRNLLNAAKD